MRKAISLALVTATWLVSANALAEVSLIKNGEWEAFSDGRISGFASYANGQGFPRNSMNAAGGQQTPIGGGLDSGAAISDAQVGQGTVETVRIRSGFSPNILGVGFRRTILNATTLTGYMQFWSDIESEARRKYLPMPVDVRVGYLKIEGSWGSVTVGRQLTLFSRGAAEIDFMYGHGYGLGNPVNLINFGPAAGHIGTGVLGPGFAAGVVYVTPSFAGVKANLSIFDPVTLQGAYERTKWPRPEAEITYDLAFGRGKLHLFVNGAYQKAYRSGFPDSGITPILDPTTMAVTSFEDNSTTVYGAGYGGRIEVGPVHFGVAGHYGQGLGLYYALETSQAAYSPAPQDILRKSDGYYAQLQLALKKFDINAGIGISRVIPLKERTVVINDATGNPVTIVFPADGAPDAAMGTQSLIKYQLGMSAAVVYHLSPSLHFDIDYFRADFRWQQGEKQLMHFVNAGVTMLW